MKKLLLTPIKWYQAYSRLRPPSCRYYPTCSEYAKWLFMFDNPLSASLKSAKRIATCNQLFIGGIDYPKVKYKEPKLIDLANIVKRKKCGYKPLRFKEFNSSFRIQFWLVPQGKHYFILKDFNDTATFISIGYAPTPSPR